MDEETWTHAKTVRPLSRKRYRKLDIFF